MTDTPSALYFAHDRLGLWLAPNPLPGQEMDTLFQFEVEALHHNYDDGRVLDIPALTLPLLGKRDAFVSLFHRTLPEEWRTMSDEQLRPYVRSPNTYGHRMRLVGDSAFDYRLELWFHFGIPNTDGGRYDCGVTIQLTRANPPARGRKNTTEDRVWFDVVAKTDLIRLLTKFEIGR